MLKVSNSYVYTTYNQQKENDYYQLKQNLEKLIIKWESNVEGHLDELKKWFDDQERKDGIKSLLVTKKWNEFETVWDGVRALLKHLDLEWDSKVKKADLELLTQDLQQLQNIFN